MMSFSVLMSVYQNETPDFLDQSLLSLSVQTLKADEIVLVEDGPLTASLRAIVAKWREVLPLKIVSYPENRGLGYALQHGLEACSHEIVARMDTDDIACCDRFERQIGYLQEHEQVSVLGGQIQEFHDDKAMKKRVVPCDHEEIAQYIKSRNPFNHMTIAFRKFAVEQAGGYLPLPLFEDYYLWGRIVQQGSVCKNLPEVLVNARVGKDMIGRRIGIRYAWSELLLFRKLQKLGIISIGQLARNIAIRFPLRLLPKPMLSCAYRFLRS